MFRLHTLSLRTIEYWHIHFNLNNQTNLYQIYAALVLVKIAEVYVFYWVKFLALKSGCVILFDKFQVRLCISLKIIESKKVWDSIIIGLDCTQIGFMGIVSITILIMSLDEKGTFEQRKSFIGLSLALKDCFATCSNLPRHKI